MPCLGGGARLRPSSPFAGIMRSTLADSGSKFIKKVTKVKAHQLVSLMPEGEEKWHALGNQLADHYADLGARRHSQGFRHLLQEVELDQADVGWAAKLVLSLCTSPQRSCEMQGSQSLGEDQEAHPGPHLVLWPGKVAVLSLLPPTMSVGSKASRLWQPCSGGSELPGQALQFGWPCVGGGAVPGVAFVLLQGLWGLGHKGVCQSALALPEAAQHWWKSGPQEGCRAGASLGQGHACSGPRLL